jgi:hypothetical protein
VPLAIPQGFYKLKNNSSECYEFKIFHLYEKTMAIIINKKDEDIQKTIC